MRVPGVLRTLFRLYKLWREGVDPDFADMERKLDRIERMSRDLHHTDHLFREGGAR